MIFSNTTTNPPRRRAALPVPVLAVLSAGLCHAAAEPAAPPRPVDLGAAVRLALAQNPALRAASWEIAKARARAAWAGQLDPPALEFSASTDEFGRDENESTLEFAIVQRFPVTGKLGRERDVSRVAVAMAEAEVAEARRGLVAEVERTFVEAVAAREEVALLAGVRDLLAGFVSTLEEQVAQGTVSSLDVNQTMLERQQVEARLRRREADTRAKLAALKTSLGLEDGAALTLEGALTLPPSPPPPPDPDAALARRPDFRAAVLNEDRARAELALAEAERWDDVAVRLFAEREGASDAPEGLEHNRFLGVGVSIPLPFRRERATAEERVAVSKAGDESRALAFEIRNEVAAAAKARDDALALAKETSGTMLALAEENLEAMRNAYASGQIDLTKYQRAQEQLMETRLASLEARAAYHTAEAALRTAAATHPAVGPPPPASSRTK